MKDTRVTGETSFTTSRPLDAVNPTSTPGCWTFRDPNRRMLTETDVLDATQAALVRNAFRIRSRVGSSRERGDDLVAVSPGGIPLYIEAKGQTSGKERTRR